MNTRPAILKAVLFAAVGLCALEAKSGEVTQLTFGGYNSSTGACDLNELGYINDPKAKSYPGRIAGTGTGGREALCNVSIPRRDFDRRYSYCALASVETIRPSGYVCEVFHFKESVVFSYAHAGPPSDLPMCSFVCPAP